MKISSVPPLSEAVVDQQFWRTPISWWTVLIAGLVLITVAGYEGVAEMVRRWQVSEEYGYGFMIPMISAFLIWQRRDKLARLHFSGSWFGVLLLLGGVSLTLAGQLSTIHFVTQYGYVAVIIAGAYALLGWRGLRLVLVPLLLLFLMVPLPGFANNNLSFQLQLISSEIGVWVIRLFGISVFLEGNVIDLGSYKLQVVEACSGLRYLFPLVALSIVSSYFYQAAVWKRLIVILSSAPITVLMNSFRIGVIGVLVEYGGPAQAEGFLHDFEGWVVFMGCVILLVAEMWILTRIGKDNRPFREVFGLEFPLPIPADAKVVTRPIPRHVPAVLALLAAGAVAGFFVANRAEQIPPRSAFNSFPLQIEGWQGRLARLENIYLDALKLDDYILADYINDHKDLVNLYVAYYASQRAGESAHSPRSCLPGGGWKITSLSQIPVKDTSFNGLPLMVNRAVIQKGEYRQLVYYWFQQRGRMITNEYMVKWYLFWDALTRNRTDGALVRLTMVIPQGGDAAAADKQLAEFSRAVVGKMKDYIPD